MDMMSFYVLLLFVTSLNYSSSLSVDTSKFCTSQLLLDHEGKEDEGEVCCIPDYARELDDSIDYEECFPVMFSWEEENFEFLRNNFNLTRLQWQRFLVNATATCYANMTRSYSESAVLYTFPDFAEVKSEDLSHFIFRQDSPAPVIIVKQTTTSLAKETLMALWEIWPSFFICMIWAIISGVLVWFLVSEKNNCY